MDSIINRIDKNQFWKFHGGIHPPEQKFITEDKPIRVMPLPEQLIIPLQQHIGQAGDVIVNVGDNVLKGQALTTSNNPMSVPIHASTSGTISAIKNSTIAHPSALQELCIFLTPDGQDTWIKREPCQQYKELTNSQILTKILDAGISGMGGAGFPTHIKAGNALDTEFLIINAAECEPYITADDCIIKEHSASILDGIHILEQFIKPKYTLIGIEENKPDAIAILKSATKDIEHIKVCVIPTKYPSGGEKQLIQILTGKELPSGFLPSSLGIIMHNIATCYAIADAVIHGNPLIKRVTTITGLGLKEPQNVWALLGTPVNFLLEQCQHQQHEQQRVIMGGPMMGFTLPSGNVPVVKTTNCILAPSAKEISTDNKEIECIRCGQCAEVCPAQLLPQELQWHAKAKDHQQLEALNLFDCIECGACAYVCPSYIPLVHYYRIGKAEIRELKQQEIKAEKAKIRFEARKLRLERDRKAREEKQRKAAEARKAKMHSGSEEAKSEVSAVAAALARVKAKKAQVASMSSVEQKTDAKAPPKNPQIAAAIARAKAKKIAKNTSENDQTKSSVESTTDHNISQQNSAPRNNDEHKTTEQSKKDKIAEAIAKAKAKKRAKETTDKTQPFKVEKSENTSVDKNSATSKNETKLEAANSEKLNEKPNKKSDANTKLNTPDNSSAPVETSSADAKKKRIAAAIAKAKAKKQQRSEQT